MQNNKNTIRSYKDLKVWQRLMGLILEVYRITDNFPRSEVYGLVSQMRKAAVSIPFNIAEGYQRRFTKEHLHFLDVSDGSGAELETQIEICKKLPELCKLDYNRVDKLLDKVMRMSKSLITELS